VASEVAAEVKCFLQWQIGEVLIPECNYLSLSNEKSKLILSRGSQFAELDSRDLGADGGGELLDFAAFGKEIFESWVCIFAMLSVGERFQGRVFLAMVPGWEVLRVLGEYQQVLWL